MSRPARSLRELALGAAPRGSLAPGTPRGRRSGATAEMARGALGGWRWGALAFGVVYLVLLAARFGAVVATTNLDADAVSAPVIGELFGNAGPHANVILGTFGWYSTLLFELATKWLPAHREVWEVGPFVMAVAGAALVAASVGKIAGRWAAGISAVLLLCAAPDALHLLLSMTQHAPDWFCCALLAAFLVLIERTASTAPPPLLVALAVAVGTIVGVNAASDVLVTIAGLGPFVLAGLASYALARNPARTRVLLIIAVTLVAVGISWWITDVVMSAWNVAPEPGLSTIKLARLGQIGTNFRLWWQSIASLGNGDYFGRPLSFSSALAGVCAAISIAAVILVPVFAGRELRDRLKAKASPAVPGRLAFVVFWCSSAMVLSGAFLLSGLPVDRHADRYLVGLVYAVAALIPVMAAGRRAREALVVVGACIFALSGITSLVRGVYTRDTEQFPPAALSNQIASVAAAHHLEYGYADYWDASAITWATNFRLHVYPVSICDQDKHLCRFDLHVITSWYTPRNGIRSFLLIDPAHPLVPAPTPDLGSPTAVYHIGRIVMYVYPHDLARGIVS